VRTTSSLAYVRAVSGTTYVVNVGTAKVVGKVAPNGGLVDVMAESD